MNLLFDLGGTNIRLAVSDGRRVLRHALYQPPHQYGALLASIRTNAERLAQGSRITGVAGGIAGPLDAKKAMVVRSPHLAHLVQKPFRRDLGRLFHAPVVLENDAMMIGLGEAHAGAGRGYGIVALIVIGTGLGGCRIVDGRLDRNALGFEPGHHIIDWSVRSHAHPSPHPGSWESFVSGSGILLQYGKRSEAFTSRRFWRAMAGQVATGLVNVTVFWSPDIIVLGGSLMKRLSIEEIRSAYRKQMRIFANGPRITKAKLGDLAGVYGALAFLRQSLRPPS